jgi:integrase
MPKTKLRNEEPEEEPGRGVYGEGSVFRRKSDGRYVASVPIGGGKKKQEYYDTKREAERARRRMLQELEQGKLVTARDQLLKDYLVDWLEVHRTVVEETTAIMYSNYVHGFVVPALGHVKLQKLTGEMVQKMYAGWVKEEALALSTIHLIHVILKKALEDAVRMKKIIYNPLRDVVPPRVEDSDKQVLTQEQARLLVERAKSVSLYVPIVLAVSMAMRLGEILALHWSDINFEKKQLEVRYTLSYMREDATEQPAKFILGSPKTKASRRVLHLPDFAVEILKEYREQQRQRHAFAARWEEHDLVVCTGYGTYMYPDAVRKKFHKLLQEIGLPDMKFHGLRHSAATILLSMGVHPKVVQELLGHSSISITLGIYGHVIPGMHEDAMSKMDDIFHEEEDDEDEDDVS